MVATTTFYLEGQDQARIALTREGLSALLVQVEAELHRSETYQEAINRFGQGVEETAQSCQLMIRAVGREAIRLALRQVVRQYRTAPSASPLPEQAPSPLVAPSLEPELSTNNTSAHSEPAHFIRVPEPQHTQPTTAPSAGPSQLVPPPPPPRAIQRVALKPPLSLEAEKRAEMLQQIGQALREAREAQGISLEQLHLKTWVPIHQLRALELGETDKLPEDVYIQGFLRRLAPVLKVEATELQGYLKPLQTPRSAVPSWYQDESSPAQLQPVHLYMGYAALMAGAAGGLMWMSQQPHAVQWSPDLQPSSVVQPSADIDDIGAPQAAGGGGAIASPETVPPQALR
ncbi:MULTISPECIES: helix-turn-helix transcriptional regulator [unclassified Leptolyngbya]|uniref:helix-turn-helix domain-containing protein n=1 Tax=unclassified Leptolyngbya TaxID=2650499 RepID=UPI001683CFB7|nr:MULTISPECIES: helix-turn-helix transcriptional regulator [unclassified Leptolyngbya]MBD1910485.1 helix-turn-helix domain-containing protein [Leptolyngbya sp. FACHB-8]MBD2153652.1 helix-turn-helix domain-containing protein [Leptolyngbya sp. FACHB-16]